MITMSNILIDQSHSWKSSFCILSIYGLSTHSKANEKAGKTSAMAEFLPLCDVLFNVISLAGYFCDVVFDVVMGYALLERGYKGTFAAAISIVITSLIISQVLSMRWYLHVCWSSEREERRSTWGPLLLHALQLGVLWRYARLLVPVDLREVKHQVRDLCMLRLVHAFCEAAPMLLLQLHILFRTRAVPATDGTTELSEDAYGKVQKHYGNHSDNAAFEELNVISASLSLFSVCWALASFSKNVRRHNVHRLLLSWLGVIFQFVWRLGTVSARMCALTVYALVYEHWVFLVIGLHWVSMFLWLISPKNVFHGERISRGRKAALSALIAFVYVFAYINLQELNHRQKMVTFYVVMCVENVVLVVAAWCGGAPDTAPPPHTAPAAAALGIAFMLLYYRYFHVRRLGYMLGASVPPEAGAGGTKGAECAPRASIPGVFNCRFSNPVNGAGPNRKKKKPTSFVPPPAAAFWRRPLPTSANVNAPTANATANTNATATATATPLAAPAPHNHHGGSSENEGSSVGSRVNIQQKLQEKKQKQLAELRVIEEEIKQGKLAKTNPVAAEEIYSSLQRQPIPRAKTHADPPTWPAIDLTHPYQNYPILPHNCNIYPTYTEIKPDYQVQNFQNNTNDITEPLRRLKYDNRTLYENPSNIRNDVNRTPIRSPNYLSERNYEPPCGSPRNIISSSPRNYIGDEDNYEIDKPRIHSTIFNGDRQEYTGYCENSQNYSKYESKDAYVEALHSALAGHGIDVMRNGYEPCGQYGQNCERFPYGKKVEQMRKMQRCRTPEILLAPHYLEGCSRQVCCHWGPPYSFRKKEEGGSSGSELREGDTPRPHSDIDSQISLPRSYTLPREFRYWRRRPRRHDAHVPSNNSSDGDVDSGGEDGAVRRARRPRRPPHTPETKL